MLIAGIALMALALFSPISVPTLVTWLIGVGLTGFWLGRRFDGDDGMED